MAPFTCSYLASCKQTGARRELSSQLTEDSQLNTGLYESVSLQGVKCFMYAVCFQSGLYKGT